MRNKWKYLTLIYFLITLLWSSISIPFLNATLESRQSVIKYFKKSIERNPEDPSLYYKLGMVYKNAGFVFGKMNFLT